MPVKTKAENAAALAAAGIPRSAFTIPELCARAGISENLYRNLKRDGRGAKETQFGDTVRVTPEDEADWLKSFRNDEQHKEPA